MHPKTGFCTWHIQFLLSTLPWHMFLAMLSLCTWAHWKRDWTQFHECYSRAVNICPGTSKLHILYTHTFANQASDHGWTSHCLVTKKIHKGKVHSEGRQHGDIINKGDQTTVIPWFIIIMHSLANIIHSYKANSNVDIICLTLATTFIARWLHLLNHTRTNLSYGDLDTTPLTYSTGPHRSSFSPCPVESTQERALLSIIKFHTVTQVGGSDHQKNAKIKKHPRRSTASHQPGSFNQLSQIVQKFP